MSSISSYWLDKLPGKKFPETREEIDSSIETLTLYRAAQIFQDVFHRNSPFPFTVRNTIGEYIPKETSLVSYRWHPEQPLYIQPFEDYVDLRQETVLKRLFGESYQTPQHILSAHGLIKSIWEVSPLVLGSNQHSTQPTFAIPAEIVAFALEALKGKEQPVVVDIGCSGGEIAALLGFSGATVYGNDIDPLAISHFNKIIDSLPENVRKNMHPLEGSCFDVLNTSLINKIDLVFCANVFHLFDQKLRADFFELLDKLLKPGGIGIFTLNYFNVLRDECEDYTVNSDHVCFLQKKFSAIDPKDSRERETICFDVASIPDDHLKGYINSMANVFSEELTHSAKLRISHKNINKIDKFDPVFAKKCKAAFKKSKAFECVLSLMENYAYNEKTIMRIFKRQGFQIDALVYLGPFGHIKPKKIAAKTAWKIAVVLQKNSVL